MRGASKVGYRDLRRGDEDQVLRLVRDTFLACNSKGVGRDSIQYFLSSFTHETFPSFLGQTSIVAEEKGKIVGFIRGKNGRISTLFVDPSYHGKGVGRGLIERFEARLGTSTHIIRVRSSLHAVDFYARMGYRKTTGKRLFHGLPMQPMKKILVK